MSLKSFSATLSNAVNAFLRGELLMRIGFDRFFIHVAYTFMLFWLMILFDIAIENTLTKVERNKAILNDLKIYHTEKKVQIVSMDRMTTTGKKLKERGSEVAMPEEPLCAINAKSRD